MFFDEVCSTRKLKFNGNDMETSAVCSILVFWMTVLTRFFFWVVNMPFLFGVR